jgi:hypothetical protein
MHQACQANYISNKNNYYGPLEPAYAVVITSQTFAWCNHPCELKFLYCWKSWEQLGFPALGWEKAGNSWDSQLLAGNLDFFKLRFWNSWEFKTKFPELGF